MSSLRLTADGDIDLVNGRPVILNAASGANADLAAETAQRLKLKFQTFLGEWFLDERVGVPYFDYFLIKNPRLSVMRSILREVIVSDPQVASIETLSLDLNSATRVLSVEFQATLSNGEVLDFQSLILQENLS